VIPVPFVVRVDCQPGLVAINARDGVRAFMVGKNPTARKYVNAEWKRAVASLVADIALAWSPRKPLDGPVRVEVLTRWPRLRRSGPDAGLAFGDVDATSKAVLDAIAKAGVVEDDGQVVECVLRKTHGEPGIVIAVEPVDREQVVMF
jgi:Holliday junction resolvase RusA-like endonuclease